MNIIIATLNIKSAVEKIVKEWANSKNNKEKNINLSELRWILNDNKLIEVIRPDKIIFISAEEQLSKFIDDWITNNKTVEKWEPDNTINKVEWKISETGMDSLMDPTENPITVEIHIHLTKPLESKSEAFF